tara:strand:+ start:659 stop:937 length:279 start_codon:yes stop_codon:yes gene_type:complete
MKAKEMIELIQQHHPHMGEVEIVKLLNRAKNDFCAKTEMVKDSYTLTTVTGQRYYDIDNRIIKIKSVWIDDIKVSKMIGKPIIDDEDAGEYT